MAPLGSPRPAQHLARVAWWVAAGNLT